MHNNKSTINSEVIKILSLLLSLNNNNINSSLSSNRERVYLKSDGDLLFQIDQGSMKLLNEIEVGDLILSKVKDSEQFSYDNLQNFFKELNRSITRINHLGISYVCTDIDDELLKYKRYINKTRFTISEESSGFKDQRWFFVGNRKLWDAPLFELVLQNKNASKYYKPHFQIDLDTDLDFESLKNHAGKYLKKNFFSFKIDIDNYGVVLGMGKVLSIDGIDVYLGLGTKLRNNKIHRLSELKDL